MNELDLKKPLRLYQSLMQTVIIKYLSRTEGVDNTVCKNGFDIFVYFPISSTKTGKENMSC